MIHLIRPLILYIIVCILNVCYIHNQFLNSAPAVILIFFQLIELGIMYIPDWIKEKKSNIKES